MKVMVTGASGLLGSAVVRACEAERFDVVGSSRAGILGATGHGDLCDALIAANHIAIAKPDVVVHCAAKVAGVAEARKDPAAFVTDNLVMSARLFEACAKAKGANGRSPLLVFVSSSTVYPERFTATDLRDYMAHEGWPLAPHALYQGVGGVKVYLESLLDFYAEKYGLRSCVVRPTAIYGPGDRSSHVIPDLLRRAEAGEDPLTVWGSPDTVRDFVYVDDVARGILATIEQPGCIVNLGSGVGTTVRELAETVLATVRGVEWLAGREDRSTAPLLLFDQSKPQAIPVRRVSIEHAKKILGWEPRVSLAEGLRETLIWMRRAQ